MSERPVVYIAAPYTHPDPVANTHGVVQIADALLETGVVPLVPHLSLLWHAISPKPYGVWLAYDRELLRRCDAVLRVPGESAGASQETDLATKLGIPVLRPKSNFPHACAAAVNEWRMQIESTVNCDKCDEAVGHTQCCHDCGDCEVCCRCCAGEG